LAAVVNKDKLSKDILNDHFYWLFTSMPKGAQFVTALETHDYYRIMDRWESYGPYRIKPALWVWLATLKGALLVYNGQERGEAHRIRIDNWSRHNYKEADRQRFYALKEFERVNRVSYESYLENMFTFYHDHQDLWNADAKTYLLNASHDRVFAFARWNNGRNLIVVVNTSWHMANVKIDIQAILKDLGIENDRNKIYEIQDFESGEPEEVDIEKLTLMSQIQAIRDSNTRLRRHYRENFRELRRN
jgi:glycosidase